MRARLVRPEFWGDEVMADLPLSARLTYIGLWCVADDAGYLEWKMRQIGAAIYPMDSPRKRDRQVESDLNKLVTARRVVVLDCLRHAVVPTLAKHRITGGNRSEKVLKEHQAEPAGPVRTHTDSDVLGPVRTSTDISRSSSVSPSPSVLLS